MKPLLYVYRVLLTGIWLMRNRPSMKYQQLRLEFQTAHGASALSEMPSDETRRRLNDLLVKTRLSV